MYSRRVFYIKKSISFHLLHITLILGNEGILCKLKDNRKASLHITLCHLLTQHLTIHSTIYELAQSRMLGWIFRTLWGTPFRQWGFLVCFLHYSFWHSQKLLLRAKRLSGMGWGGAKGTTGSCGSWRNLVWPTSIGRRAFPFAKGLSGLKQMCLSWHEFNLWLLMYAGRCICKLVLRWPTTTTMRSQQTLLWPYLMGPKPSYMLHISLQKCNCDRAGGGAASVLEILLNCGYVLPKKPSHYAVFPL